MNTLDADVGIPQVIRNNFISPFEESTQKVQCTQTERIYLMELKIEDAVSIE